MFLRSGKLSIDARVGDVAGSWAFVDWNGESRGGAKNCT